jgi:hypothetical protein
MHEGVDTIREQKTKNNNNHNKNLSSTNPDRRLSRPSPARGVIFFL